MFFKKEIKWYKVFDSIAAAELQVGLNTAQTIIVRNKKICFARTLQGLFAVNDKCPHNGASLGNGYCTAENSIVCPLHRYHFDLKSGRAKSGLGDVVDTYPVDVRADGIYVGLKELVWSF